MKTRKSIVEFIIHRAQTIRIEAARERESYSVQERNADDFDSLASDLEDMAEAIRLKEDRT